MNRWLHRLLYEARRAPGALWGALQGNAVTYYAWRGTPNFGDGLTAPILCRLGFTPVYSRPHRAQLIAAGSLLDAVPEDYPGWILGAGLLHGSPRRFPSARVRAVRGELTRQLIGAPTGTVLGDPGWLATELLARGGSRPIRVGLVPHYVDRDDPRLAALVHRFGGDVRQIDVRDRPQRVVRQMEGCQHILSSSLHGLIAADSLGIPNGWIRLSERLVGGRFKFDDYASSLGRELCPHPLTGQESLSELEALADPVPATLDTAKQRLANAFADFAAEIRR